MSYELATQRACEAYYGDPQANPGPIIQAVLALLAAFGVCPAAISRRTVMNRPRIAKLEMTAMSYRLKLADGVDRNEAVATAMVVATQSTLSEYEAFHAETPPENVKAMLPN